MKDKNPQPRCKPHKWAFIAESRYSHNEWCEVCGVWKRYDVETAKTTVMYPKGSI